MPIGLFKKNSIYLIGFMFTENGRTADREVPLTNRMKQCF